MRGWAAALASLLLVAGCASFSAEQRLAGGRETLCLHCNCLMPADIDPHADCPVCHCHKKTGQCVLPHD